jgi:hypothetical protein
MGWTSDAGWRCVLGKDWAAFFRLCVGEGWGVGVWGGDFFVLIPFLGFGHSFGGGGVWFADAHYLPHSSAPRLSPTRRRFTEWEIRLILFCLASSFCYCFGRRTRAHTPPPPLCMQYACVCPTVSLRCRLASSRALVLRPTFGLLLPYACWRGTSTSGTPCTMPYVREPRPYLAIRGVIGGPSMYLFSLGLRLSTARPRLRPLPLHEHHRALWRHRRRRWRVSEYVPAVCSAEFGNSPRFPRTAAALL